MVGLLALADCCGVIDDMKRERNVAKPKLSGFLSKFNHPFELYY